MTRETNKHTETMKRQNNGTRRTAFRRTAGRSAGAVLLAAILLATGCSKEFEEVPGGGGGGKRIEVGFETPQMDEVHVGTRAETDVDAINDIWVLQFNAAGTAPLQPAVYLQTITANRIIVDLQEQESIIYFIANTGDETLLADMGTAAQVEAVTRGTTVESDCYKNGFPMGARLKGVPSELDFSRVYLVRAVAKLRVNIQVHAPGSFAISSCDVYNVPREVTYYRDPDALDPGTTASATYPATSKVMRGSSWYKIPIYGSIGECYLPENGRGKGTATRQEDKTAAKALGGASGQGNYATYVEITGTYTANDGTVFKNTKYRIYLGGDTERDYNLKRNTYYNLWCTIRGINQVDARITVGTPTYTSDYYDYTDNRTGRFLIAKSDAANGTMVTWINAEQRCRDGWRLPTVTELGTVTLLGNDKWWKLNYGMQASWYHTNTFTEISSGLRFAMNNSNNLFSSGPTSDQAYVRCVKDVPFTGVKKYPYITTDNNGKRTVIVFREGSNGVNAGRIRANINSTDEGWSISDENWKLPAKLQVGTESLDYDYDVWQTVYDRCKNYREGGYSNWRLPNPREAFAIANYMDELDIPKWEKIYLNVRIVVRSSTVDYTEGVRIASIYPRSNINLWWGYTAKKIKFNSWACSVCRKDKGDEICVRDA